MRLTLGITIATALWASVPSATTAAEPLFVPLRPLTSDYEVIYGDPTKAGKPFVMRIRELAGTMIPPHTHPVDEHITVLQGSLFFAVSETVDMNLLKEYKAGSYIFIPKGRTMFGRATEAAVVQVHGVGPFDIHWREPTVTFDHPEGRTRFRHARGQKVNTPRGPGEIKQGWSSGRIIQYEVMGTSGELFMAHEADVAPVR